MTGPRTEPCGTPLCSGIVAEVFESIWTQWVRSSKYVRNHDNAVLRTHTVCRVCYEDVEKCVVAKVGRFPKATHIESYTCLLYDVLHWDLVFNKIVIVSTKHVVDGLAFPKGRPWIT